MDVLATAALLLLVASAASADLRSRRIPNRLTLCGAAVGLALGAVGGGLAGFAAALGGGLAGFAVFFGFFALRAMGAGDVKLMAAAGTFLGVPLVFWGMVCSAIAGAVLALALIARQGAFGRVLASTRGLVLYWLHTRGVRVAAWLTLDRADTLKIPFGVGIAVGCAFAKLFPSLSVF